MSKELVEEFFERDLSDEELQALKDSLDSEAALRFAEKAYDFHRNAGILARMGAELRALGRRLLALADGALVARAITVAAGLVLVLSVGAIVVYKVLGAQEVFVMAPLSQAVPGPDGSTVRPAPLASGLAAVEASRQLVIHLTLKEPAVVETVVRKADGILVCSLGSVVVDAGEHRLVWNGRAPDGSVLPAGRYQVVTRWDGQEVVRWVELQAGRT